MTSRNMFLYRLQITSILSEEYLAESVVRGEAWAVTREKRSSGAPLPQSPVSPVVTKDPESIGFAPLKGLPSESAECFFPSYTRGMLVKGSRTRRHLSSVLLRLVIHKKRDVRLKTSRVPLVV
ncbi:hypothetical protein E2C01_025665 [Portunus trituberculatus]|uniref:Uncharacterized protein n=1 Tax=Portunus trituberculatus TaxID=210409 RepID=A0A5B7EG41_PORTR|nr:hypothetical protein [Portunus trituberculatus]